MRPTPFVRLITAAVFLLPTTLRADNVPWTTPTVDELRMTSEPKAPGAPAIILSYDETDDSNSAEVTVHVRIKILTAGGISAGNIEIPDRIVANDEFSKLFAARTIHADGIILLFVSTPANTTTTDDEGFKHKVAAMPDVQAGSIVEYVYHFASMNTAFTYLSGLYAPTWRVQQAYFIRSAHFSLHKPDREKDPTKWVANLPPGAALKLNKKSYDLDLSDVPAEPDEEFAPPASAANYHISFFYYTDPPDKYWGFTADYVDRYWSSYDNPRKALTAAVRDLIQGAASDTQKLHRIYDAVEQLENTDFTRERSHREDKAAGAHDINNSDDLWARKRGDSDELTHLFVAMARAAGFKAYPMAVASRGRAVFNQNVLSWSQFDSLIAIVVVADKELFFDPGTRLCPYATLSPAHSDAAGISIEGKLVKFRTTVHAPLANDRTERTADLTIARDGSVTGTMKMVWLQNAGLPWRAQTLREDDVSVKGAIDKHVQKMLPDGIEIHLKSLAGLDDGDAPLIAEFTVSGKLGVATQKRIILPAEFFASKDKAVFAAQTRTQPIYFPATYVNRDQLVLHLPAELTVESAPQPRTLSIGTDTAYATLTGSPPKDPRAVVSQRTFLIDRLDYQSQDYPGLRKYFGLIAGADQDQIVLHIAAATPAPSGGNQ